MPIVVHLRTSIDNNRKYGADQTRVFLNEVLAAASGVPVQNRAPGRRVDLIRL